MSSPAPAPGESRPRSGKRRFTVDALFTDHRPQAVGVEDMPTAKEIGSTVSRPTRTSRAAPSIPSAWRS